jgi:DUF1009 family protein
MKKLGLIAGGGPLPVSLALHCRSAGRPLCVIRLTGMADPALAAFEGGEAGLGELGKALGLLRRSGCEAVCLAGVVARPDFRRLRLDARGVAAMPGVIKAARLGDDGLLRFMVREFEKEGFAVEGAHEVMEAITLPEGALGRFGANAAQMKDALRALDAARQIGRLDIGQAAVCCDGLILALEAQEGTKAMLGRVAQLPAAIRGRGGALRGVLAKACKPQQDPRVDLPAIGPETVTAAAAAGLAGIVGEAGRLLVLERESVTARADELGLFVIGLPRAA